MKLSLIFSDSGVIGKVISGFFSRIAFRLSYESVIQLKNIINLNINSYLLVFKNKYLRIPFIFNTNILNITNLKLTFFYAPTILFLNFYSCNQIGLSNKQESNNDLLLGLVAGQTQIKDSLISINGYWEDYYYNSGVLTKSGNLIISTNLNGTGTWSTTGSTSNDRVNRIVEYDNSTRIIYYQQGQGTNNNFGGNLDYRAKFGRIVWTLPSTTGCESSSAQCFYYCESVYGKDSLLTAKSDSTQVNSTNPSSSGCGGSSWNRALIRQGNPNW